MAQGDPATSGGGDDALTADLFGLANTGIGAYTAITISKNNAKALQKTPPASIGIIVAGLVIVVALFALGGKRK